MQHYFRSLRSPSCVGRLSHPSSPLDYGNRGTTLRTSRAKPGDQEPGWTCDLRNDTGDSVGLDN